MITYQEMASIHKKFLATINARKKEIIPLLTKGHKFTINNRKVIYEITSVNHKNICIKKKYVKIPNLIYVKVINNRRKRKTFCYYDTHFYINNAFYESYRELSERDKLELL